MGSTNVPYKNQGDLASVKIPKNFNSQIEWSHKAKVRTQLHLPFLTDGIKKLPANIALLYIPETMIYYLAMNIKVHAIVKQKQTTQT